MSDRTEPEAERPARPPMDIGQLIVDRAKPVIREGGYAYEGPLVAEKWTRLPGGDFLVLLKLGNGTVARVGAGTFLTRRDVS